MENTELLNEWRRRIADYRAGDLTMLQWCEKTGYSIGQLKYWIAKCNKLARKSEAGGWARVDVVDSNSTAKIHGSRGKSLGSRSSGGSTVLFWVKSCAWRPRYAERS